jgi:acyl-homoserine lactone acylase PvdQ
MNLLLYLLLFFLMGCAFAAPDEKEAEYQRRAGNVTIVRDNWGIPHIYGKTDADAVFGVMYAQCEESFERVERAYIEKLGRLSEVEGKSYLLQDIKMRLLYDTASAIADYNKSPQWLKNLLQAFSDGIHFYLLKHPDVKPLLLTRFEPWLPLLSTDGAYIATQTGGLQAADIKALYAEELTAQVKEFTAPDVHTTSAGSNGFALSPSRTADQSAMLYINPHVSFYFRTEMHVISEEGLNAYGAITWGQFFVFQGFNEHCGWMHTSTAVDAADLYEEQVIKKGDSLFYWYDGTLHPVQRRSVELYYKDGRNMESKTIQLYATHHGPLVGMRNNKWLSLKAQNQSMNGLIQSWQRTKAKSLEEFVSVLQLRGNPTTNTLYADKKGNIAYWHGNFLPKRAVGVDPFLPLDGSTPKTEWQGLHEINELLHFINPSQSFLQNCNSSPFSAAGVESVSRKNVPLYMAPEGENFRSIHALQLLSGERAVTLDRLIGIGYNPYLAAFDTLFPPLFAAFELYRRAQPVHSGLNEAIDSLQRWNKNAGASSVATTLAVFWAYTVLSNEHLTPPSSVVNDDVKLFGWISRHTPAADQLTTLQNILSAMEKMYGTWKVPWGQVNRFQRLSGSVQPHFDDNRKSLPVGLGPSFLGSLPSYETVWQGNKKWGVAGNSFVAAVSFGQKVRAKAVSTGGQSFDTDNEHFNDQAMRLVQGELRDVWFYKEDVLFHAEKTYHPGEFGSH